MKFAPLKLILNIAATLSLLGCTNTSNNDEWMTNALFGSSSSINEKANVKLSNWSCKPNIVLEGNSSTTNRIPLVESIVLEIREITKINYEIVTPSKKTNSINECGNVHLIFTGHRLRSANNYFRDLYLRYVGIEAWNWDAIRQFADIEERYHENHPCKTLSMSKVLYNETQTQQFSPTGHIAFSAIFISDEVYSETLEHCLREELAHALFLIPDRNIKYGWESIFNLNMTTWQRKNYSKSDIQLIKFVARNAKTLIGMDPTELRSYIKSQESMIIYD